MREFCLPTARLDEAQLELESVPWGLSGIVGGGRLGPCYDHNYRRRLRPLPNGDVEYFDGRGRRERFELTKGAGSNGEASQLIEHL